MAQKDVGNKIPIYKLKTTEEVMKYYDEWGEKNKYDQDMKEWNYTGPKETTEVFIKYAKDKNIRIYDAGCGTGLVGIELKKYNYTNIDGADLRSIQIMMGHENITTTEVYTHLDTKHLFKTLNKFHPRK